MSRPVIPGFYFDESRKRYFRIVNGDQRHNAAYTNNTVRAEERRKQFESDDHDKLIVDRRKSFDISKNVGCQLFPAKFSDWLARRRLGISPGSPGLINMLNNSKAFSKVLDYPSWPIIDDAHIIVAKGSFIALYVVSEILVNEHAIPLVTYRFPDANLGVEVDPMNEDRIQVDRVDIIGEWMTCWYGETFRLLRWHVDRRTGNHFVTDVDLPTQIMARHPELLNNVNLWSSFKRESLFTCFDLENLHLYFKEGLTVVVILDPLLVISASPFHFENALFNSDSTMVITNDILSYNVGSHFVTPFYDVTEVEWDLNYPLLSFYTSKFDPSLEISGSGGILRLFFITTKEIIIRDVNGSTYECLSEDLRISIRNDNQARPIIYKSGEHILVEEGIGIFKIVDTRRLVTSTVKLELNIPSPRGSMPRMYQAGGRLLLAAASGTYAASSFQTSTINYIS